MKVTFDRVIDHTGSILLLGVYVSISCIGTDLDNSLKGNDTVVLKPVADAYVDSRQSSNNFGDDSVLLVDGSPGTLQSLLRFSIPSSVGSIVRATLRLYSGDGGNDLNLYATSNSWSENTVTWNNKPSQTGSRIAILSGSEGWQEIDVTDEITGSGDYSFLLTPRGNNGVDFHSSEGSNEPELVYERDDQRRGRSGPR